MINKMRGIHSDSQTTPPCYLACHQFSVPKEALQVVSTLALS